MSTQSITDDVKKRSAWSIAMGTLTAVLGVFLVIYPFATAMITTVLLGWILVLVGIAQFVFALHTHTVGNFFLKVLLGILYAVAGIALAFLPIEGVIVLTGVLGTLLLIQAGMLTVTAFQMKPLDGWGWYLADAIASLLLGILIFVKWPNSSMWAIGTLVGVAVLVGGISRIMLAAKIRSGAGQLGRYVGGPA
ncbi:MAG TPA: DUF308 domain-containing protein [Candidatus Methylomirabilis sp.]|nr:DUF308 domain-containing protein [Candidatus Methylomirabilis sp.]